MDDPRQAGVVRAGAAPPPAPPHEVHVPVNVHDWQRISFLHWPVDPVQLSRLVPDELAVLTYDGAAWVSVTPFFIRVRPPGLPAIARVTAFPETNVRTYVAGPDGREGLWFLRMEVTQAWFVVALRALGLPYVRQRMRVDEAEGTMTYTAGPTGDEGPTHRVVVRPGRPLEPPAGDERTRFLTARWGAYHRQGRLLFHTPADHPPWPLHAAEATAWEVGGLLEAAGLPPLDGPPLVHFSPGVTVKIGRPERAG